jgi:hypothetical protein
MTDETSNNNEEQIDYKSLSEQLQSKLKEKDEALNIVASKKEELLAEKKREAQRAKDLELEKAKAQGDWEALVKDAQEREKSANERLQALQQKITQKEIRQRALQLASKMDPNNDEDRETVADYLERQIKIDDGKELFLDNEGKPSVMNEEQFIKSQIERSKFKSLLRGNEASGGGAPGSKVTRGPLKSWNQMSEQEKTELFKSDVDLYRQLRDQAKK